LPFRRYEDKVLLVLTLVIGAVVGLVVVAFILLTENLGSRLYPAGGAAWRRVLIPVAGALSTGYLLFRYFPNARGSGIPQTKVALFLRDGYITMRTVLGKFGLCSVSLASGMALGREGPSVHVGAGIASVLGRKLGLSAASVRALVPAGASAALAAAFNTPVSAVLFSLEEVMGDMHAPILGSIVLSSATSWIVLHLLLGDEPLFHVPAYQLVHPVEFVFYAALGVVGGLVSVAFVKTLLWQRERFLRMPRAVQWCLPGVGGLTVGLLGWFYPQVLGVGYSYVGQALNGQMVARTMALLVILKLIATATCYATGNAGGIFGPSLFLGAMLGGATGAVAHMWMPDYTGGVGAYALVGMGAAFAGIVRVPLTSVIMIFEITRDYSIIVPLMISNMMSYFISTRLQEEPIYEALQHQEGIHLPTGARAREALLTVAHAFHPEAPVLSADELVGKAFASVDRGRGAWAVVDAGGLRGMVTADRLEQAMLVDDHSLVGDLVLQPAGEMPHLHPDDSLDMAVRRIAQSGSKVLPVVSRTNQRDLRGSISLDDILAAYETGEPREDTPQATPERNRMLWGLLALLAGLALLMGFLNYFYRTERIGRAQRYFEAGNNFAAKDRLDEAIAQYRDALSIAHIPEYRLALAQALAKAGNRDEATLYFREVLREQPNNGPANLGVAEIAANGGDIDAAVTYFHRAIYGSWPPALEQNRTVARLELVQALWQAGRKAQAQAELILLAAQPAIDLALRKQIARIFSDYGLPEQSAALFRSILKEHSDDGGAWYGLGDAEFAQGHFTEARDAYRAALKINPADMAASKQADLCDRARAEHHR
jgi:CIC family chloride channel protein